MVFENQGTKNLEIEKSKEKKFSRVVISMEARDTLERLVSDVNHGFIGGEVTVSDVANWLIEGARKGFSRDELKEIRTAHTDERKILEMILAGSAKADDLPEALRKVIRELNGLAPRKPYQRGYEERERIAMTARLKNLKTEDAAPQEGRHEF